MFLDTCYLHAYSSRSRLVVVRILLAVNDIHIVLFSPLFHRFNIRSSLFSYHLTVIHERVKNERISTKVNSLVVFFSVMMNIEEAGCDKCFIELALQ